MKRVAKQQRLCLPRAAAAAPTTALVETAAPPACDAERMLNRVEVARLLGVHPESVAKWAREGRLPVRRAGSGLRFLWSEVCAHLGASRTGKDKGGAQ